MKALARLLRRTADRIDPASLQPVVMDLRPYGGDVVRTMQVQPEAFHRALLDLKRRNGGAPLGLS